MIKSKLVKTRCRNVFENVYLIWLQNIYIYIYLDKDNNCFNKGSIIREIETHILEHHP